RLVAAAVGAGGDGRRLDFVGRDRGHLRAKGLDPAFGGVLRRHLDLRGDAFVRVEPRSEEHTSELQSRENLVCRLLLENKQSARTADPGPHTARPAGPGWKAADDEADARRPASGKEGRRTYRHTPPVGMARSRSTGYPG